MATPKLKVPANGLFNLSADENDISTEIKDIISGKDSTKLSTTSSTTINTNDNVENKNVNVVNGANTTTINTENSNTNKNITTSNSNNKNKSKSTVNSRTRTKNKDKPTNTTNDKNTSKSNNTNKSNNKVNTNDDLISGIVIPTKTKYTDNRKQRSYYVFKDNLEQMEAIVDKYGLDRSDMVNQALSMFFKALEKLEQRQDG